MFDELVIVVSQQALPEKLRGFPTEFDIAIVIRSFQITRRLAVEVHHVAIHALLRMPSRHAIEGGFHMVVIGSRTHDFVVKIVVTIKSRFYFSVATVNVEITIFGGHGPAE